MNKFKHPRTFHVPFSKGISSDDKVLATTDHFNGEEIIVTEKMDGENTSLYHNYFHARSIDGNHHPSRNWVKAYHATIKHLIPEGDRICGENVYAQHSIMYDNLKSYFYGFAYWCGPICLDWDNTIMIFDNLGIVTPNVLYRGQFDINVLKELANSIDTNVTEGFVCRVSRSFMYEDFGKCVAKWVRKGHVNTDDHWMHQKIIPNRLQK